MTLSEDQPSVTDIECNSVGQTPVLDQKSALVSFNEAGLWNDDLRLLVTVGGTEYLFEKLNLDDPANVSSTNGHWPFPKKVRFGKSTLHKNNTKQVFRDNAIKGIFPKLNRDSLCVKPDINKGDIDRTIESIVGLQVRLGKELHNASGFTELLEKKKAIFSFILDAARVKYGKQTVQGSLEPTDVPAQDDRGERTATNAFSFSSHELEPRNLEDEFSFETPMPSSNTPPTSAMAGAENQETIACAAGGSRIGSNALVELGVTTGLSLMFALMRQNWMTANAMRSINLQATDDQNPNLPYLQLVGGGSIICNQVLRTARTVLLSLPPLSLSSTNSKMPDLGEASLDQVTEFLSHASSPVQTGGDVEGAQLCSEILLLLAVQRGRLSHILVWIHSCLRVSSNEQNGGTLFSSSVLKVVLRQMQVITNIPVSDESQKQIFNEKEFRKKDIIGDTKEIPTDDVNQRVAALFILSHLVSQTSAYTSRSIINPFLSGNRSNVTLNPITDPLDTKTTNPRIQAMEAYLWGSNSSHQLAEGAREKIVTPKMTNSFRDVLKLEAGQYCTFVLHTDGRVSGCGKGSYGRLGLGDSSNQVNPRLLPISSPVKFLSSSRGSDGHTLALTETGHIYSWGDGDYGKLGHGNTSTQKLPKRVVGPLVDKLVVQISAGYRHSAAVTDDGFLYTWGEGDFGRLGHGDSQSRFIPTLVKELNGGDVGQVSCGASHTLALSTDGRIIWAFGSGDHGKLGHGDTARLYRPKTIDSIQGLVFQKVQAGGSVSLALTDSGQIWAWGSGPCLGVGTGPSEASLLLPRLIDMAPNICIVDISLGDSHCLALGQDCSVYSWGLNSMGQCGLGHNSPVYTPQKISSLDGIPIHQISAGTSHSMAWTTLPPERSTIPWHKPFCVDNSPDTFKTIINILKEFGFHSWTERKEDEPSEGGNGDLQGALEEREGFILSVLNILIPHLSLLNNQVSSQFGRIQLLSSQLTAEERTTKVDLHENLKTNEKRNNSANRLSPLLKTELVSVLQRFLDSSSCPKNIICAVEECFEKGIQILLPSIYERVRKACSLLDLKHDVMKQSQKVELKLILQSLNDPAVIGSLLIQPASKNDDTGIILGLNAQEKSVATDIMHLLRILLRKAILYSGQTLLSSDSICNLETKEDQPLIEIEMSLLFTLHTHFVLANLNNIIGGNSEKSAFIIQMNEMAVDYLKLLFLLCHDLFEQCYSAISPPLPDEQIDSKSLSSNRAKNIFSPDDAATTIHILHLTLVKLFDVPSNFIKPFLSQLVEFQRSSMMLVDNVINSFLSDENRYGL